MSNGTHTLEHTHHFENSQRHKNQKKESRVIVSRHKKTSFHHPAKDTACLFCTYTAKKTKVQKDKPCLLSGFCHVLIVSKVASHTDHPKRPGEDAAAAARLEPRCAAPANRERRRVERRRRRERRRVERTARTALAPLPWLGPRTSLPRASATRPVTTTDPLLAA